MFKFFKSKANDEKGMTLLEIMVVLVILGGLATVLISQVMSRLGSAKMKQARIQIGEYVKNLDMYYTDCTTYPTTDEGLQALVTAPASCTSWGPEAYIKRIAKDPWGKDLVYESDGSSYVLKSLGKGGKDGGSGEEADISSEDL